MSGELIALLCVLCLVPISGAVGIILFALGGVRCGRMMDPYTDGGDGGTSRGQCPMSPHGPRLDRRGAVPAAPGAGGEEAEWWPQFERELGRYVKERESSPSAHAGESEGDGERRAIAPGAPPGQSG